MRAEAFSLGLGLFWNRYTGLAYTAVGVIIKLVQRIHIPSLAPFAVKVAAIVLKRVKVLRHSLHQLFETRVRLWAGLEIFQQFWKFSRSCWQQWPFLFAQTFPIEPLEPSVGNHLLESVREFVCAVGSTSDPALRPSQQTGQKVNAFTR